jgi:hypothetical protein
VHLLVIISDTTTTIIMSSRLQHQQQQLKIPTVSSVQTKISTACTMQRLCHTEPGKLIGHFTEVVRRAHSEGYVMAAGSIAGA